MRYATLLLILLLYVGIGAGLGGTAILIPRTRRAICHLANTAGMHRNYAQAVWFSGTLIAWPIGLYVLATGRLVLGNDDLLTAAAGQSDATESQEIPAASPAIDAHL